MRAKNKGIINKTSTLCGPQEWQAHRELVLCTEQKS